MPYISEMFWGTLKILHESGQNESEFINLGQKGSTLSLESSFHDKHDIID